MPTNPPGIIALVTQKPVVRTVFDPDEEKRLRQKFDTLLRPR